MKKQQFAKPAIGLKDQVERLLQRGMDISDPNRAEFFLQHINYYRLGAYWLPFESDHATHQFRSGTTFDTVLDLYSFDRELRLLILDAIERIEVSLRSVWAHTIAIEHGPHAHLDASIMKDKGRWRRFLTTIQDEIDRSNEVFVKHFFEKYIEVLPPIWSTCEVMSLGSLSKWYENLAPKRTRSIISNAYGINERVLESWCKHLAYIRNLCAHHSRVWNREFIITPAIPKSRPVNFSQQLEVGSRRIYNTLVILLHLLDTIAPQHTWRARLIKLVHTCVLDSSHMGFPADWESRPIWLGDR